MDKKLKIGFNTFDNDVFNGRPHFELPLKNGVDYVLCHTDPHLGTFESENEKAKRLADILSDRKLDFIANFEFQNTSSDFISKDGHNWISIPDGSHRLNLPEGFVKALASNGNLIGITYDEFEHTIVNRNISVWMETKTKVDKPVFSQSDTKDIVTQGEALSAQVKEYADSIKAMGAPVFSGEHVFPVLYHTFARNGIIPNFKSQKESYSNLQFAIAAGAALQYGTPLWNCVDMWHKLTHPGHSAKELYHNLVFAYLSGVNRVYVESGAAMIEGESLNDIGEAFVKFTGEYKGKERDYDISDYRPEIGIIRYDDTYWGQNLFWARGLFGNKKIRPTKECKEWITIINTLTFGQTKKTSFTWNRITPASLKPHRSFVTMNSLAVFDDRVTEKPLSSLKLAFLCGVHISEETLKTVAKLVKENGLTVVTSERYAPESIRKGSSGYREIKDGKGCWIVTNSFADKRLKKRIAPFMGKRDVIRLTFDGGKEVKMKVSADGETFTQI